MGSIKMAFQHCIWNTKNREPQISDESIREEFCEFIKSKIKAMNIGIDEMYCSPDHLHCLCVYPENESTPEIFSKLREQAHGWLTAKGYPDVEWDNDYLTLPVMEDELESERLYIRGQKSYHQMYSLQEEYSTLFSRII